MQQSHLDYILDYILSNIVIKKYVKKYYRIDIIGDHYQIDVDAIYWADRIISASYRPTDLDAANLTANPTHWSNFETVRGTVHDKCAKRILCRLRSVKSYSTVINCANDDARKGWRLHPLPFPLVRTYDLRQWDRSARPFARANAILPSPTANGSQLLAMCSISMLYEQPYVGASYSERYSNMHLV